MDNNPETMQDSILDILLKSKGDDLGVDDRSTLNILNEIAKEKEEKKSE